jgi:predicted Na+-dependent transporter
MLQVNRIAQSIRRLQPDALGVIVLPIMIYHPMQLVVCAWLARRYANRPVANSASRVLANLPAVAPSRIAA